MLAESPDYKEDALVFADGPELAGWPAVLPNVLLTRIGVSYFTNEKPELYKDIYELFES